MKHPRLLYTTLALLGVGVLVAATVPQLSHHKTAFDDLRDRANRMEHDEFVEYALTEQDSLIRTISSREWVEAMGVHAGSRADNPLPDSIAYRCTPTLYDLIVAERIGHWMDDRDSLLRCWSAFHAEDSDPLPCYYISFCRGDDALQAYNAAPDSWERGLLLLHAVDSLYPAQQEYVAKYKNGPLSHALRKVISTTEQQSASIRTIDLIRTTDSVRIRLDVSNAHRVQLEIYELPKGKKATPKNLKSVRRHLISVEGTIPFRDVEREVILPPLPLGQYYIYAALPDDKEAKTVRDLNSLYYTACVEVSDIRTFSQTAAGQERGDIHVVDALSGEPLSDFRTTYGKYRQYTVTRGKDSSRETYPLTPSRDAFARLRIYPSTPICRAGDTVHVAIVAMEVAPSGRRVLAGETLGFTLRDTDWNDRIDTTLTTDADGVAELAIPFTDDMRRGTYWATARTRRDRYNVSGDCYIELADYRMPTAEMHAEAKVVDSLVHLSGTVLRTTGMPVQQQPITAVVMGYLEDTLTLMTNAEGRFTHTFTRSASDSIRHQWGTVLFSTTLQGEYLEARAHISSRPPHPIMPRTEQQDEDTIPAGTAFILPRQSFAVAEDGTVSVLVRSAADLPLFILASCRDSIVEQRWTHISRGDTTLTFHVPTDEDDYLSLRLIAYLNGIPTSAQHTFHSPNRHELRIVPDVMRDYLVPGTTESWQLRLTDQHGQSVAGRMILSLTNTALSSLCYLPWRNNLPKAWSESYVRTREQSVSSSWGYAYHDYRPSWSFPSLPLFELSGLEVLQNKVMIRGMASKSANVYYSAESIAFEEEEELDLVATAEPDFSSVATRMADTGVGLYRPDLISDKNGRISLSFLTPMDNTSWLLQAVAWTRDGATGQWSDTLVAKREVMVHLSQPRFLRQGDRATVEAVVTNAADRQQQVSVLLEVFDPASGDVLYYVEKRVLLKKNEERTLPLTIEVGAWSDVAVRIRAIGANGASDGEQRALPILTVDAPVREAQAFCTLDSVITLTMPARPKGATDEQVMLTYCTSPIPTILSGLAIDDDTTFVTATATMHRLYALAIRNRLAADYPEIVNRTSSHRTLAQRLLRYQRVSGAFAWLEDSRSRDCYYTTLCIVSLMQELEDADALPDELKLSFARAKTWLGLQKQYREREHMLDSLSQVLPTSCLAEWPYLALRKHRQGKHDEALQIVNAMRRYSTVDREKGMYWNNIPDYWWWMRTSDIEATFMLAFARIDPQEQELAELRQWLILNHHTCLWGKSSLAAYCAYAMTQGLSREQVASMDTTTYRLSLPTGTTTYTLHLSNTSPFKGAWGSSNLSPAIGALAVEYQAPLNQIQAYGTRALRISREYLVKGKTVGKYTRLHAGDRITVRLTVETDREYDNLTLTDRRAALLEPTEVLSGYGWQDALYYREVRDQYIAFYITHLSKGKTVLTYDCILTTDGTARSGLSDIVSDLAPEYTAHTGSEQLKVE